MKNSFHGVYLYRLAMQYLFTIVFVLLSFSSMSQNLVPNPSFEEYESCDMNGNSYCQNMTPNASKPCYSTCCYRSLPTYYNARNSGTKNWWSVSRNIYIDNVSTPLYFNACIIDIWKQEQAQSGNRANTDWYLPRTGRAYIMIRTYGIWNSSQDTDTRDYAQVRLTAPLQAGCTYEASCYVLNKRNVNDFFLVKTHKASNRQMVLVFIFQRIVYTVQIRL